MKIIINIFFVFSFATVFCQNEIETPLDNNANVKFYLNREITYFEIKVNDSVYINPWEIHLSKGSYKGEIWSPYFNKREIEFLITNDTILNKQFISLNRTNDYIEFSAELKKYNDFKRKAVVKPTLLAMLVVPVTGVQIIRTNKVYKKLHQLDEIYSTSSSPAKIHSIKQDYEYLEGVYNRRLFGSVILSCATLASTIYLTYSINKIKKKTEPKLLPQISPFTGEEINSFS